MKQRYLVTGATGFVGSVLTRALVSKRKDVAVIARNKKLNWRLSDIKSDIHIYETDLVNKNLQSIINEIKPTIIFHLAVFGAVHEEDDVNRMIDTNIKGTYNLVQAVKKHPFNIFINTGSSSEYGVSNRPFIETDNPEPINDYGVTKNTATLFCKKIATSESLPIITFRLFSPYGYYENKTRLVPWIILNALLNKPIPLSSREHVRDFIFVEDVVDAYMKALSVQHAPGDVYNIGSGYQHNINDILTTVLKITKSNSYGLWGQIPKQTRQTEPKTWRANNTKAKRILQWEPNNSLTSGLEKTIAWFKNNQELYEKTI